jgi:protease II
MLLTCSQLDLRVPFWGPLKYAALVRAAAAEAPQQDQQQHKGLVLLLPCQTGHFVHEQDVFETKAQQYAFLMSAIQGEM